MTDDTDNQLVSRERIAHIDQMLADIERTFAQRDRTKQEMRHAPWLVAFAGMTAGAALMGTGIAVGAGLLRWHGL